VLEKNHKEKTPLQDTLKRSFCLDAASGVKALRYFPKIASGRLVSPVALG